jgi:raffinose/stachyose/melibiose transport system substrate-binding protein
MQIKKAVSLLLAGLLSCSAVAGCSSSSTSSSSAAPASSAASAASGSASGDLKMPSKNMTIKLWDIATDQPGKKIQEDAIARFMKANPNVKVEETHIQNDSYKQKLVVAMSSGQCPTMYIHWGGGPMNEYIDSGFAQPVTDLMKNCKVKFLKAAIEQSSYKDQVYAVPFGGLSGSGIFYNKTLFQKYGIQVPTTIAELEKACDTLKANKITPFSLANQSKWTGSMYFMYLVARKGGVDDFNKAVAGTGSFDSASFQYAGDTIQKWVKAGYFPDGVNSLSADDKQDLQLMYQNKAAMMLHGSWQAGTMKQDNADWYTKNVGYFAFPKLDGSSADQSIVVGTSIGNGFSFNTGTDKDLLTACFILATQYYNDDTYNKAQLAAGNIPSIEGMGDTLTDPCTKEIWKDFSSAKNVQLWYDQYLPPAVSEIHKTTSQKIFGLSTTPKQADQDLQTAMQKYLSSKKK